MRIRTALLPAAILAAGWLLAPALMVSRKIAASDHGDTFENAGRPGVDMADVYLFPSPVTPANVVVVMNVHPLIPAGQTVVPFDPQVLYQMKFITKAGGTVEDTVIQFRFIGTGATQHVQVSGPAHPLLTGTTNVFGRPYAKMGLINTSFSPTPGMTVFAGTRSDPFFFDLNRFFMIFPDRETPLSGEQINFPSIMDADTPMKNGFRGFAASTGFDSTPADDLLATLNVLSIVVELPRSALGGGMVKLWETTSIPSGFQYVQQDRLARPAVNEAFATVTANRHEINNKVSPNQDPATIEQDILTFMNFPAGRSPAIAQALASVLVPDVMVADLSQPSTVKASYLGVETGGFTGGLFGGRGLPDDVIDIDLMAIFGPVIPKLNSKIPDDGKELPQFETDNIGPHTDYQDVFPYLGNPLMAGQTSNGKPAATLEEAPVTNPAALFVKPATVKPAVVKPATVKPAPAKPAAVKPAPARR